MFLSQHLITDGTLNIRQGSVRFRHLGVSIAASDYDDNVQLPREFVHFLGPRELTSPFVRREIVTNR
jgi:hypothetical protein